MNPRLVTLWCSILLHLIVVVADDENENGFLVGGEDIEMDEYAWFATIRRPNGRFVCSGALIAPRYVVTAKQCLFHASNTDVEVGYYCRKKGNCGRRYDLIAVEEVFRHSHADFAILQLDRPVNFPVKAAVPYLGPSLHRKQTVIKRDRKMVMVGPGRGKAAGASPFAKKLEVQNLPLAECDPIDYSLDSNTNICSESYNGYPCKGVAGAALVVPGKNKFKGRDVIMAIHVIGPTDCGEKPFVTKPLVHFRMENASQLLLSVVCEGPFRPKDWCDPVLPPPRSVNQSDISTPTPTILPSSQPTKAPSLEPSVHPSSDPPPSAAPSRQPSNALKTSSDPSAHGSPPTVELAVAIAGSAILFLVVIAGLRCWLRMRKKAAVAAEEVASSSESPLVLNACPSLPHEEPTPEPESETVMQIGPNDDGDDGDARNTTEGEESRDAVSESQNLKGAQNDDDGKGAHDLTEENDRQHDGTEVNRGDARKNEQEDEIKNDKDRLNNGDEPLENGPVSDLNPFFISLEVEAGTDSDITAPSDFSSRQLTRSHVMEAE